MGDYLFSFGKITIQLVIAAHLSILRREIVAPVSE